MQQWLREAACPCGSDAAVSPQATVKAGGGGGGGGAPLSLDKTQLSIGVQTF